MTVPVMITADVFEHALDAAEKVGRGDQVAGLGAPLGAALLGRVGEAWDQIRYALQTAYRFGAEKAVAARDKALEGVDAALSAAGDEAAEMQAALVARMRRYSEDLLRGALRQVEPTLTVGDSSLQLADVVISRRFIVGGSLKASITELVALTAGGELLLETKYSGSAR